MAIDNVLNALTKPRKSGKDQWRARCPACGDKNQTKLSVKDAGDGRVLLHCFAGCSVDEVVGAMGLKIEDLMPEKTDHGKPVRNPFRYEAIGQLKGGLNEAWVYLNDISRGRPLTDGDRKKAGEYARRAANLINELG